ncbi:hypothetical protein OUZ56_019019 [Daphnia magna]|uniref:Uncharacterized protein n=1 Tax=Daphnia magna TaxID=35525 RepID=A0ABQ9ZAF3_9CRUS|nr:hypothetical protein OUZ56_019019 [Daphnia magna]
MVYTGTGSPSSPFSENQFISDGDHDYAILIVFASPSSLHRPRFTVLASPSSPRRLHPATPSSLCLLQIDRLRLAVFKLIVFASPSSTHRLRSRPSSSHRCHRGNSRVGTGGAVLPHG